MRRWCGYLEQSANDLHMAQLMLLPPIISCFIKIQNGSAFLVPAYPGCPGKEAVKWVLLLLLLLLLLLSPHVSYRLFQQHNSVVVYEPVAPSFC